VRLAPLLLAALLAPACREPATPRPPDIVLVVIQTLGAQRTGLAGPAASRTPHLDALANAGVRFEDARAASSFSTQSLAALWTGRLPSLAGAVGFPVAAPADEVETLPRRLRRAGYATALVTNDPALRTRPFTRGFTALEVDSSPGRWDAARVTETALELLDEEPGTPRFLTVVYTDATPPYLPDPELRATLDAPAVEPPWTVGQLAGALGTLDADVTAQAGFRDLVARYEAELLGVDRALGALVDGLAARGRLANTLLVVTADTGVEFLEHGGLGAGWTLHDEVVHVPLVFHAPALLAQARVATAVSLLDVAPSLLGLCGLAFDDAVDGRALFADGAPHVAAAPVLSELRVPEIVLQRVVHMDGTTRIEVVLGPAPGERATWFAGLGERLEALAAGQRSTTALEGEIVRVEGDGADQDVLARVLAAFAQRCLESPLATGTARIAVPTDDGAPIDADELRQIGYL
jgi:membrane-anchored protein YejM (alkaline phosphatase superfamily)